MTPETKHHLLIAGAVGAGALALYGLYRHATGAGGSVTQPGADQANQGQPDATSEAYLQELALSGAFTPVSSGVMSPAAGVEAPNFSADLESSIQLLQGAGILPTPQTTANTSTSPAPAVPTNPNPPAIDVIAHNRPRRITGKRFFPVVL